MHGSNRGGVPCPDILIKICTSLKCSLHIRNRGHIPVTDVSINGSGIGLGVKPQIDGTEEIGIVQRGGVDS